MLTDTLVAWIRTVVPVAVGSVVAWLASVGVIVGDDAGTGAVVAVTGVTIGAYYTLVKLATRKWPWLEVLLGHPASPTYSKNN